MVFGPVRTSQPPLRAAVTLAVLVVAGTLAVPVRMGASVAGVPQNTKTSRLNPVIERLEKGGRVLGTFPAGMTGLAGGRTLAASENQFVMLDLQYGAFDL